MCQRQKVLHLLPQIAKKKKSFTEYEREGEIQATDTIDDKLGLKIYEFLLKTDKYN